jgi:hypothetical protein
VFTIRANGGDRDNYQRTRLHSVRITMMPTTTQHARIGSRRISLRYVGWQSPCRTSESSEEPMTTKLLSIPVLALALAAGCYTQGRVGVEYTATATTPDLVYVSPGVMVVADYPEPVFYSSNYYWRYNGGIWYRSHRYNGGWSVSANVPVAVRSIDRPTAYVHYRSSATVHRDHRGRPTRVRDHRR